MREFEKEREKERRCIGQGERNLLLTTDTNLFNSKTRLLEVEMKEKWDILSQHRVNKNNSSNIFITGTLSTQTVTMK